MQHDSTNLHNGGSATVYLRKRKAKATYNVMPGQERKSTIHSAFIVEECAHLGSIETTPALTGGLLGAFSLLRTSVSNT